MITELAALVNSLTTRELDAILLGSYAPPCDAAILDHFGGSLPLAEHAIWRLCSYALIARAR